MQDDTIPVDLTGASPRIYMESRNEGSSFFADGVLTDPEKGMVKFVLPYQAAETPGTADCEIFWFGAMGKH